MSATDGQAPEHPALGDGLVFALGPPAEEVDTAPPADANGHTTAGPAPAEPDSSSEGDPLVEATTTDVAGPPEPDPSPVADTESPAEADDTADVEVPVVEAATTDVAAPTEPDPPLVADAGPPVDAEGPPEAEEPAPAADAVEEPAPAEWNRARGGTVLIVPDAEPDPTPDVQAVAPDPEPEPEPEEPSTPAAEAAVVAPPPPPVVEAATVPTEPVAAPEEPAGEAEAKATLSKPKRRLRLVAADAAMAVGCVACIVLLVLMVTSRAAEADGFDRASRDATRGLVASVDSVIVKLDQFASRGDADVALLTAAAEEGLQKAGAVRLPTPRGDYRDEAQQLRRAADRIVGFHRALAAVAARDGLDLGFGDTGRVSDAWDELVSAMKPVLVAEPSVAEPSWTMWERVVGDAMRNLVESAEAEKRALELHERQIRDRQTARADLQRYRDKLVGMFIRYAQLRDSLGQFRGSERIIDSDAAEQQFRTTFLQAAAARQTLLAEMKALTPPAGLEEIHTGLTTVLERQAALTREAADAAREAYCYTYYFYSSPCETVGTTSTYQEFLQEGAAHLEQFQRFETEFHSRYEALVRRLYQR